MPEERPRGRDGQPCTLDDCDPAKGCASKPVAEGGVCADGKVCKSGVCAAGG